MAFVDLVGEGLWLPPLPTGITSTNSFAASDSPSLLDADEEEFQMIGAVCIDGGGSKTFGTSGSKIGWLPGALLTFAAGSTLTVGVKKAATIDAANGPVARATIGAAAFDVYKALVGGTDAITATTWREDAMASGTPFTVADGDLIAICFHLDTTSGTPAIKVRCAGVATAPNFPACTLITSGPTYTAAAVLSNAILIFDDGTIGWLLSSYPFAVADAASANIGNGNIFGNIFRVPFPCKINAIAATVTPTAGSDFALELYSTPLGTPGLIESIAVDQNISRITGVGTFFRKLATPRTLTVNTDYAVGVKQTTATNLTITQRDQSVGAYNKAQGMGAECYAATSTAGATFADANATKKRRYHVWARVCALDDGISAGGPRINPGLSGGLR